jgi:hypothetical protein
MITHDKLYILDFRQNLSQQAIDDLIRNRIISRTTKIDRILEFKEFNRSDTTYIQLTDEILTSADNSVFTNLTHLSKIIIRGHGNAGLDFVASDEYSYKGKQHAKEQAVCNEKLVKIYDELTILKQQIKVRQDEIVKEYEDSSIIVDLYNKTTLIDYEKELISLKAQREVRRNQIPLSRHAKDQSLISLTNQTNKIFPAYKQLREEMKQSKLAYLESDPVLKKLEQDRRTKDIESNTLVAEWERLDVDWLGSADKKNTTEKTLKVEELAVFLKKQIPTMQAETLGAIKKRQTQNETTKGIVRRLTIQCAMCHGGEAKANSPAFCQLLRDKLAELGLEVNVIGYLISTRFLHKSDQLFRQQVTQSLDGSFASISIPIGYKSTGVNVESKFKDKSTADGKPGVDISTKIIFNAENPKGADYNIWKGQNFTGNQGPMVDLLAEMQAEIWSDHWNNEGKGFFGSKLPDGIVKLRRLLPETSNLNLEDIDSQGVKKIWNSIKEVLADKVGAAKWSRKAVTADIYLEYHNAMKGY